MKLFFLALFISTYTQAQICEDDGQLGTLSQLAGQNCLSQSSKDEMSISYVNKDDVERLCKTCESKAYSKLLEHPDANEEKETAYGRAILEEVQKELSFISMDLMKMRMSFGMNLTSKKAVSSCNFKQNLKKPSCLTKEQEKAYDVQVSGIQNALATELADIISDKRSVTGGLFTKRNPSCEIQDKNAMFAYMRYLEHTITPTLLADLQQVGSLAKNGFTDEVLSKLSSENQHKVSQLRRHPLFSSLLSTPSDFKKFVNETLKSTQGKNSNQIHDIITENLYESASQGYANRVEEQCNNLFNKATDHLKHNFCKDDKKIVADDLESIEAISGKTFFQMDDAAAEKELKAHCALINSKKSDAISFTKVKRDLHLDKSDGALKLPMTDFKSDVYSRLFLGAANNICEAQNRKPACAPQSEETTCVLLLYYKETESNKHFKEMASQSDDNINQILQALVGDGLPQKDGKVDQTAVVLLQKERILPGGTASNEPAPKKASASEFHKTVRSSGGGSSSFANNKPAPTTPEYKPGEGQTTANPVMNPNMGFNSNRDDEKEDSNSSSTSQSSSSSLRKASKKASSDGFSALSDQEQQELINRLKKGKKSKKAQESMDEEETSYGETTSSDNDGTFTASTEGSTSPVDNTRVAGQRFNDDRFSGKKATIDPVKKVSSVNSALIDANTNRPTGSSSSSTSRSPASVNVSTNAEGESKIEIKMDASLQGKELVAELEKTLKAQSQNLPSVDSKEKMTIMLNDFEIIVTPTNEGKFLVECKNKPIPDAYIATIQKYFTDRLHGARRADLERAFKRVSK